MCIFSSRSPHRGHTPRHATPPHLPLLSLRSPPSLLFLCSTLSPSLSHTQNNPPSNSSTDRALGRYVSRAIRVRKSVLPRDAGSSPARRFVQSMRKAQYLFFSYFSFLLFYVVGEYYCLIVQKTRIVTGPLTHHSFLPSFVQERTFTKL